MERIDLKKVLIILLLLLAALVSIFIIADKVSSAEANARMIASLDSKIDTVLKLTGASTGVSAVMTILPGDTATPIAEKMTDFTEYFVLVLCVLYAEKFLLTLIGGATFKILIPVACVLVGIGLFKDRKLMNKLAFRVAVFGIAVAIMIPTSIFVSDTIYATQQTNINATITAAEDYTNENESDDGSILPKLLETAVSVKDNAVRMLNRFIETLAVMIVTSCVIPILVLLFFIWLIKVLTGTEIKVTRPNLRRKKADKPAPANA